MTLISSHIFQLESGRLCVCTRPHAYSEKNREHLSNPQIWLNMKPLTHTHTPVCPHERDKRADWKVKEVRTSLTWILTWILKEFPSHRQISWQREESSLIQCVWAQSLSNHPITTKVYWHTVPQKNSSMETETRI